MLLGNTDDSSQLYIKDSSIEFIETIKADETTITYSMGLTSGKVFILSVTPEVFKRLMADVTKNRSGK